VSDVCRRLRERVRCLTPLAGAQSEAVLLRAAVLLEQALRRAQRAEGERGSTWPDAHPCPRLAESIALHYLLLADHAEVRTQPGLSDRYRARARGWVDEAERGEPSLSGFLERTRADA
jgi:hypothetical protein